VGWAGGLALPGVWVHAGAGPGALVLAGGLLYTAGAVCYRRRRPDPHPSVFGYHEVFHAFVCAAAACQYAAIARLTGLAGPLAAESRETRPAPTARSGHNSPITATVPAQRRERTRPAVAMRAAASRRPTVMTVRTAGHSPRLPRPIRRYLLERQRVSIKTLAIQILAFCAP